MGVGTCLIAVESADDVGRARGWAVDLGGHAQVSTAPTTCGPTRGGRPRPASS